MEVGMFWVPLIPTSWELPIWASNRPNSKLISRPMLATAVPLITGHHVGNRRNHHILLHAENMQSANVVSYAGETKPQA